MKRISILALCMLLGGAAGAVAQDSTGAGASVRMEWMQPFVAVDIQGLVKVILNRVAEAEEPKVSYDTKANPDSKVKATVDKHGVLRIVERGLHNSTDTTILRVNYRRLESLKADGARVCFENAVEQLMFDAAISGGSVVELPLATTDAVVTVTGKCAVRLTGACRYLDLEVSTARVDASALKAHSARVEATHKADVVLRAVERLDASVSQAAVTYLEEPTILRVQTLFGGRVEPLEPEVEPTDEAAAPEE